MQSDEPSCPLPNWEQARLAALRRYNILDTPEEAEFDDLTKIIACVFQAPIAVVNFIDDDRQWFKSEVGLGTRETPLDVSICKFALFEEELMVVPDTTLDSRFKNNPLVTGEPFLRFYAGSLLKSSDGLPLGTLCVLDHKPRQISEFEKQALSALARQVMTMLELRLATAELARRNAELVSARSEIHTLEKLLPICSKCKKIRKEDDSWIPIETFLCDHLETEMTHGLCPICVEGYLNNLHDS